MIVANIIQTDLETATWKPDPASLDPELRTAALTAIVSAAFGLISLCGGITSGLGVVLRLLSLKTERSRTAMAGIGISILGMIISIIYTFVLMFNQ